MSNTTAKLIETLRYRGAQVEDLRGELPKHATKEFGLKSGPLEGVAFHHSATKTGDRSTVFSIARYHVGSNHISGTGCPGICYSIGIGSSGTVFIFHDLEVKTWSHGNANDTHFGCLVIGDFTSSGHVAAEPSPEQLWSVCSVALACREIFGKTFEITGHYQFGKPACPGTTIETMARAMNTHTEERAEEIGGVETLEDVQEALLVLDYEVGTPDGVMGPRTKGAICAFQKDSGLYVDGVAGKRTKAALTAAIKHLHST